METANLYKNYISFDELDFENHVKGNLTADLLLCYPEEMEDLDQLEKIVKAIQYPNLDEVLTLSLPQGEFSFFNSILNREIDKIILMGVQGHTIGLHLELPQNRFITFRDIQIIRTADPETLAKVPNQKRALWSALKEMFEL